MLDFKEAVSLDSVVIIPFIRFLLALNPVKMFKINEKKLLCDEHYPGILVTFMSKTEHFSGENGAFRRSILWRNKRHTIKSNVI